MREKKSSQEEISDHDCPVCGKHKLVIKWSINGKFLACPSFPECKYTEPFEPEYREETDKICDKCGAPMVLIKRGYNKFLGCSKFPDCSNIKAITTGINCPEESCDGELVERRTRRGRIFFGCNSYPKCNYATWDKPVKGESCPSCKFPFLVEKTNKTKGTFKICPSCNTELSGE